jgi:hypothetical protein
MNPYEEELQNNFEKGKFSGGDELDTRAYQQVFQSLKKEPDYSLPNNFADKLVERVVQRNTKKGFSTDLFWFIAGILSLIIALIVSIAFTGFKLNLGFLSAMNRYKGLLVFATVFIAFLDWLDKRLIRNKQQIV